MKKNNIDGFILKKNQYNHENNVLNKCSSYININNIKDLYNIQSDNVYEQIFDNICKEKIAHRKRKKEKSCRKNKLSFSRNSNSKINETHRRRQTNITTDHQFHAYYHQSTPSAPVQHSPSYHLGFTKYQSNKETRYLGELNKRKKIKIDEVPNTANDANCVTSNYVSGGAFFYDNSFDKTPKKSFTDNDAYDQEKVFTRIDDPSCSIKKNKNTLLSSNSSLNKYDYIKFVCSPIKKTCNYKSAKNETEMCNPSLKVVNNQIEEKRSYDKKHLQHHNDRYHSITNYSHTNSVHYWGDFNKSSKNKSIHVWPFKKGSSQIYYDKIKEIDLSTGKNSAACNDATSGKTPNTNSNVSSNESNHSSKHAHNISLIDLDNSDSINRLSKNFFINNKKFFLNDFNNDKIRTSTQKDHQNDDLPNSTSHKNTVKEKNDISNSRGTVDLYDKEDKVHFDGMSTNENCTVTSCRNTNDLNCKETYFSGSNKFYDVDERHLVGEEDCDVRCYNGEHYDSRKHYDEEHCTVQHFDKQYYNEQNYEEDHYADKNYSRDINMYVKKNCKISKCLYSYLDVAYNCSKEEIKKSYKDKIKVYHPDKGGSMQEFLELKLSYDILNDDKKRKMYDKYGHSIIELLLSEKFHDYNISSDEKNEEEVLDEESIKIYDLFVQKYNNVSYLHNLYDLKINSNQYNQFQNSTIYFDDEDSNLKSVDKLSENSSSSNYNITNEITIFDTIKKKNVTNLFNELNSQFEHFYKNYIIPKTELSETYTNRFNQSYGEKWENQNSAVVDGNNNISFLTKPTCSAASFCKGTSLTPHIVHTAGESNTNRNVHRNGHCNNNHNSSSNSYNSNNHDKNNFPDFFREIEVSPMAYKIINENNEKHIDEFYKWFDLFFEHPVNVDDRTEEHQKLDHIYSEPYYMHSYPRNKSTMHSSNETRRNSKNRNTKSLNNKKCSNDEQNELNKQTRHMTPIEIEHNLLKVENTFTKKTEISAKNNSEQLRTIQWCGKDFTQYDQKRCFSNCFININVKGQVQNFCSNEKTIFLDRVNAALDSYSNQDGAKKGSKVQEVYGNPHQWIDENTTTERYSHLKNCDNKIMEFNNNSIQKINNGCKKKGNNKKWYYNDNVNCNRNSNDDNDDDDAILNVEEKYGFNLLKKSKHKIKDMTHDFNYVYIGNSVNKKKKFLLFIKEESIKKFLKIKLLIHKIKKKSNLKHISLFENEIDKNIKNIEYILLLITYKDELIPLNDFYLLDKNIYSNDHYCIPLHIKKKNKIARPTYFHFKWIIYTIQSFILFNLYFKKVNKYMCSFPFFNYKYNYFKRYIKSKEQTNEDNVKNKYIFFQQYIIKNKYKYLGYFPHNIILHLKNIASVNNDHQKPLQINLSSIFVLTPNKSFSHVDF
ncbi:DnaJ protein [Plasmodium brasilianum]|uniref:DnaJ protein n=1 Tax=Plasmodium brasilianum TaxID=5824 RepID=A0ACB9YCB1_PLABR|nr:DnaJ protein [Plasmodium brasilianum]